MSIKRSELKNAILVNLISDIQENDRLFYEEGYYHVIRKYRDRAGYICEDKLWVKKGLFQEIKNVGQFLKEDIYLNNKEYIAHHNFIVVRPEIKNPQS